MAESKDYETTEGARSAHNLDEALRLHHLATADPEPERGIGTETGAAHEKRFGLEREQSTVAYWRGVGVHPYENRALRPGDEGYVDPNGDIETAAASGASEKAVSPSAAKSS